MPTFRSTSQAGGATAANITGTEPAGGAQNDVYFAALYRESDTAVTPPAGWSASFNGTTLMAENNTVSSEFRLHGYWIRRGAGAPALGWTFASSFRALVIAAYSGALASGDPWSFGTFAMRDTTAASTYPAASGTTVDANESLVWHGAQFVSASAMTQPTGFTERLDASAGPGGDMGCADKVQAVAGATGSVTGGSWTPTNSTSAVLLAGLRPTSSLSVAQQVGIFDQMRNCSSVIGRVDA